jgi:small redox-active disulfide protein 2
LSFFKVLVLPTHLYLTFEPINFNLIPKHNFEVRMLYVQIVGSGIGDCEELENLCRQVIDENSIDAKIVYVTDAKKFVELGVLQTPGLIINGKVVSMGKIPDEVNLLSWIFEAQP